MRRGILLPYDPYFYCTGSRGWAFLYAGLYRTGLGLLTDKGPQLLQGFLGGRRHCSWYRFQAFLPALVTPAAQSL